MEDQLLIVTKKLISILPRDWERVIFSLFIRNCEMNGKKALSKEFKCKCIAKSCDDAIDIVKFYEESYEEEDILFENLDYWYSFYKELDEKYNLIIFKLSNDGNYEILKLDDFDDKVDGKTLDDRINSVLMD